MADFAQQIDPALAEQLLGNGFSPVLIAAGTRKPLERRWPRYCRTPITAEALARILGRRPGLGLGVALGYANVFGLDIDTDREEVQHAIGREFPLAEAPGKTGLHGATYFFRSENPLAIKRFDGTDGARLVDLLGHGSQSVIPPSRYWPRPEDDDGVVRLYGWLGTATLFNTHAAELTLIKGDVAAKLARALAPFMPEPKPPAPISVQPIDVKLSAAERKRYIGKARASLAHWRQKLAEQRRPGRGDLLFKMACSLGCYVHFGLLPAELLHRAALDASIANGFHKSDGAAEIGGTIRRGLAKAQGDPLPELVDRRYGARR